MLFASSFILIIKNAFSIFKFLIAVFLFAKQIIKKSFKRA
ncbi:putative membrane protein [Helicobacter pylori R036d]|uniref:Putative membrane protein n=1 Tax=Helicobacter pylori R036d TaxID=1145113 RepID=K2L840_HELPX|nr:putative membrane protein [Helicobacter pylori R036d]